MISAVSQRCSKSHGQDLSVVAGSPRRAGVLPARLPGLAPTRREGPSGRRGGYEDGGILRGGMDSTLKPSLPTPFSGFPLLDTPASWSLGAHGTSCPRFPGPSGASRTWENRRPEALANSEPGGTVDYSTTPRRRVG